MNYLILGGTGTLGKAVLKKLLQDQMCQVTVFSRGELAQKDLAQETGHDARVRFIIGDIRDLQALSSACYRQDVVFHFAALKHVDLMEVHPEESVKTNILGTMNVAEACIQNGVKHCLFSSTDKAVEPVNAYGMSKGIAEKILLQKNQTQKGTHFSIYRWGNVCASRGSVIPHFIDALRKDQPVKVTHPDMSRFWIRIEDAVSFMLERYVSKPEEVNIPHIQSASVLEVVETLARLLQKNGWISETIGTRPGEKLHEKLSPELCSSDPRYRMRKDELAQLLRPFVGGV